MTPVLLSNAYFGNAFTIGFVRFVAVCSTYVLWWLNQPLVTENKYNVSNRLYILNEYMSGFWTRECSMANSLNCSHIFSSSLNEMAECRMNIPSGLEMKINIFRFFLFRTTFYQCVMSLNSRWSVSCLESKALKQDYRKIFFCSMLTWLLFRNAFWSKFIQFYSSSTCATIRQCFNIKWFGIFIHSFEIKMTIWNSVFGLMKCSMKRATPFDIH